VSMTNIVQRSKQDAVIPRRLGDVDLKSALYELARRLLFSSWHTVVVTKLNRLLYKLCITLILSSGLIVIQWICFCRHVHCACCLSCH